MLRRYASLAQGAARRRSRRSAGGVGPRARRAGRPRAVSDEAIARRAARARAGPARPRGRGHRAEAVLEIPRLGTINPHYGLLPALPRHERDRVERLTRRPGRRHGAPRRPWHRHRGHPAARRRSRSSRATRSSAHCEPSTRTWRRACWSTRGDRTARRERGAHAPARRRRAAVLPDAPAAPPRRRDGGSSVRTPRAEAAAPGRSRPASAAGSVDQPERDVGVGPAQVLDRRAAPAVAPVDRVPARDARARPLAVRPARALALDEARAGTSVASVVRPVPAACASSG